MTTEYNPTETTCPGDILGELLQERGMSKADLAKKMGWSKKAIEEIVSGERAITIDVAVELEQAMDTPASFWFKADTAYREFLVKKKAG